MLKNPVLFSGTINVGLRWEQGAKCDEVCPGGMRVEVLTNQNGGVGCWVWSDNAF